MWERGEATLVALNLSEEEIRIADVDGVVRLATARGREGEHVGGTLTLAPFEGAVAAI